METQNELDERWEQAMLALSKRTPAQAILDDAIANNDILSEWLSEYLIGDYYTADQMHRLKPRNDERRQRKQARATKFLDVIAEIIVANPASLTARELELHKIINEAFLEHAEIIAEDM